MNLILCIVLIMKVCSSAAIHAECLVSIQSDLNDNNQPLLLIPGASDGSEWAYPKAGNKLAINKGDQLYIECAGSHLLIGNISTGIYGWMATCINGSTFDLLSHNTSFSHISCASPPQHKARYTGETCDYNSKEIEAGYLVGVGFIRTYLVCYNPEEQMALWSMHKLSTSIAYQQVGFTYNISNYYSGNIFNITNSMDHLYKIVNQRTTINNLLGLPHDSFKYIKDEELHLKKRQLTPHSDFVYVNQQRTTFWYVNVAPQWQTSHESNWDILENDIRNFQHGHSNDISIYTGTYEVAMLPHEVTGEEFPLYLYVDGNNRGIPVPEIYWKVAYDPVQKAAVAFVIANNPYVETIKPYCTNVCDKISWLTWDPDDVLKGLGYCCDVKELKRTIAFIPSMNVTSLLF